MRIDDRLTRHIAGIAQTPDTSVPSYLIKAKLGLLATHIRHDRWDPRRRARKTGSPFRATSSADFEASQVPLVCESISLSDHSPRLAMLLR